MLCNVINIKKCSTLVVCSVSDCSTFLDGFVVISHSDKTGPFFFSLQFLFL